MIVRMQASSISGNFINKKGFQNRLIKVGAFCLICVLIATALAPHVFVVFLTVLTCLIGLLGIFILMRAQDSVMIEVSKLPSGNVELFLQGSNFELQNPEVVYFGIEYGAEGLNFLRLGIPSEKRMIVLEEMLERGMVLQDVPAFKLPAAAGKPLVYESRQPYPGDLSIIARYLGLLSA